MIEQMKIKWKDFEFYTLIGTATVVWIYCVVRMIVEGVHYW